MARDEPGFSQVTVRPATTTPYRPGSRPSGSGSGGQSWVSSAAMNAARYQNPTNMTQGTASSPGINTGTGQGANIVRTAPMAYMGSSTQNGRRVDTLVPTAQAASGYMFLSKEGNQRLAQIMDQWYGEGRWDPSWIPKLWGRAVQASAYAYQNSGQKLTPLDVFGNVLAFTGGAGGSSGGGGGGGYGGGGYGGGGGGGGPVTSMATSTSVNLTDPGTARGLLDNALSQYLGRKPTAKENRAFLKALNIQESANPTMTTQMSVTTPGVGTSMTEQQVMSSGGFNPSTFAEEFAASQEGAGEYQAATTFLDAFIGALGARV